MRKGRTFWFSALIAVVMLAMLAGCGGAPTTPSAAIPPTVPAPTAIPTSALDTAALDAYIARLIQDYDIPGVGLAVVQNGQIAYTKGYGVRDVTTGAPVTPNTQFAIGSVTKSFTALGVMLLVQDGKVKLDDPVTKYISEFKLSDPSATAKVTVRHLLSHTTGMVRNDAASLDPSLTREDLLKLAATVPLQSQPGEKFAYSNLNTTIAGVLIERVSGQHWEDFTRERILTPLGMTTATLDVDQMQQTTDFAHPHEIDVLKGNQLAPFHSWRNEAPAAAINASAAEMARYIQFQVGDGTFNGQRLLSQELLAEMHRPVVAAPDLDSGLTAAMAAKAQELPAPTSLITDTGYALYWTTEDFQGHRLIWHDGIVAPGYTAMVTLVPEIRGGVVILTNATHAENFLQVVRQHAAELLLGITPQHDTRSIVEGQAKILGDDNASRRERLGAARSYKADPTDLQALVGEYQSLMGDKPSRVSAVDGTKLQLNLSVQGATTETELIPYSREGFIANTGVAKGLLVSFKPAEDGKTVLILQGRPVAQK
jgi:CubicO group peptidase (beta-lactamase class C family)